MGGGRTFGHVAKGIPQHPKVEHLALQIIGLGVQLIPGNIGPAVLPEHARNLGKGEACRLPEFDQGQRQENVDIELPPQPMSADRADQADLLVVIARTMVPTAALTGLSSWTAVTCVRRDAWTGVVAG
jgi:hypothetical protein